MRWEYILSVHIREDPDGQNHVCALLCHQHELHVALGGGEALTSHRPLARDLTFLPDWVFGNTRQH